MLLEQESLPEVRKNSPSSVTENSLRGRVEKILFEKDDFRILQLRDAENALHCVCGVLAGVGSGQGLDLKGHWENHKEFGRRFRVSEYQVSLPTTVEGIEKYLSSGVIKGIGEKYARAIVETFGATTLDVLDNASVRLKEVPGLGKKRIEAIKQAWDEGKEKRTLQLYMQSLGITPAYFQRIYSVYGAKSAEILRTNPYLLASDVDGIGFLLADRIASKTGIEKNDTARLVSGVRYALEQVRMAGHTCCSREEFLPMLENLLEVDSSCAEKAIEEAAVLKKILIVKAKDGREMIYEPGMLRAEVELPRLLANLSWVGKHFGQALASIPVPASSRFSEEQLAAVRNAGLSPVTIITGGPGVGKTTVISEIVRRARIARLKVVLAAPTGRAAKRMSETTGESAYTLHRLLKWDPSHRKFVHDRTNPLEQQMFVLDETSMLDLPLTVAFLRAVRPGASIVFVGDADQLPSVGPGNVLNDMIACGFFPVTRLTKIFRQGDGSGIICAAHDINKGIIPRFPAQEKTLTDFYLIEKEEPEEVLDLMKRLVTERIPKRFGFDPRTQVQIITPMNRGLCGTVSLNECFQELLNPSKLAFRAGDRLYKVGDKVMQTSNNYDKGVFNGDMGVIRMIRHEENEFTVSYDIGDILYKFEEAKQLSLAYAVTVHKSQGSEFPAVVMPVLTQHYMMLQRNLLYTGVTRAKKLMILIGSTKALSMAVRNTVREPRITLLRERFEEIFSDLPSNRR